MKNFNTLASALFLLTLVMTGCGGGSDSGPSPAEDPTLGGLMVLEGRTADGYLVGANVYVDINQNGQWDSGESKTVSEAEGYYRLIGEGVFAGPVVVEVIPGVTIDMDNPGQTIEKGYTLTGPASSEFVSPITTLFQYRTDRLGENREAVIADLQSALGAGGGTDLLGDYIMSGDTGLHGVAQTVVEKMTLFQALLSATGGSVSDEADKQDMMLTKLVQDLPQIASNPEAYDPYRLFSASVYEQVTYAVKLEDGWNVVELTPTIHSYDDNDNPIANLNVEVVSRSGSMTYSGGIDQITGLPSVTFTLGTDRLKSYAFATLKEMLATDHYTLLVDQAPETPSVLKFHKAIPLGGSDLTGKVWEVQGDNPGEFLFNPDTTAVRTFASGGEEAYNWTETDGSLMLQPTNPVGEAIKTYKLSGQSRFEFDILIHNPVTGFELITLKIKSLVGGQDDIPIPE